MTTCTYTTFLALASERNALMIGGRNVYYINFQKWSIHVLMWFVISTRSHLCHIYVREDQNSLKWYILSYLIESSYSIRQWDKDQYPNFNHATATVFFKVLGIILIIHIQVTHLVVYPCTHQFLSLSVSINIFVKCNFFVLNHTFTLMIYK